MVRRLEEFEELRPEQGSSLGSIDMFQLWRLRIGLWLIICVISASLSQADAESLYGTAADPFEVERVGLTREWIIQLPFDSDRYRLNQIDTAQ